MSEVRWRHKVILLEGLLFELDNQVTREDKNRTLQRIDDVLDFWGEQGYQLVSVQDGVAYFKRPINERRHLHYLLSRMLCGGYAYSKLASSKLSDEILSVAGC